MMKNSNKKNKKHFFISIIFVFFLFGAVLSVAFLEQRGFFQVTNFETTIVQPEDQKNYMEPFIEDLKQELQKKVGQSLFKMNLTELVKEVQKKSWVKEVHVRRVWPHQVHLQIDSKSIQMLYRNKKSQIQALLEDGALIESPSKNFPVVPYLKGKEFESQLNLRRKAVAFLSQIPKDGRFQQKEILEIQYSEKEGFQVSLEASSLKVNLGTEDIEKKSKRVSKILDYLDVHKLQAESLDLSAEKKAFAKIKKSEIESSEVTASSIDKN
ncbi:MAG TPA: FtsQ-type POTRA domain-containing protein [Pseudobdellovibrionaceae bacterium]|nr:FtsQ-type POTRA domain-containing protein [Pseudobdellovibrionaceae bacterium]